MSNEKSNNKVNIENSEKQAKAVDNNTKTKKMKSSLRSNKDNIEKIKQKILNVFDNENIYDKINLSNSTILSLNDSNYMKAFDDYENSLDLLFSEKMKKINEINKKYEPELYQFKKYLEEEELLTQKDRRNNIKAPNEVAGGSVIKLLYDSLIEDKNKEIKEIQDNFQKDNKKIKEEYREGLDKSEIEDLENKSASFCNELYDDIKNKINGIIKPKCNKKVKFDVKEKPKDLIEEDNKEAEKK